VKVGDLYGSVFELLDAKSFAKLISEGEDVEELTKQSVDILKTIHSSMLKDGELPSKKKEGIKWAEFIADYLPEEIGAKLVKLFEEIPETNNIIHGDFHIKNIMKQNDENLLIDMDTLSMGHPVFELAAIYAAYIGFGCIDKENAAKFFGIKREQTENIWKYTVKYYFEGKSEEFISEVCKMIEVICYARILRWMIRRGEDANEEQKQVRKFCENYLIENVPKINKLYF
ncbi:MAG: phosphotransferase, partial [Eubacterium sp.]|nr:phosphotransferase [Eubacterium sp.]